MIESSRDGNVGPLGADILGPGVANPYYELGNPTDGVHEADPVGVMLEIHGGGWVAVGPHEVELERPDADFWRSHGWETVNLDYRGCQQSVDDVYAFYTRVRLTIGKEMPICATGQSVGGTLALLLAVKAGPGGLACVISEAGITDINELSGDAAYPSGNSHYRSQTLLDLARVALNTTNPAVLATFSPISYAQSFTTPVLLSTAINDILIPQSQATSFRDAVSRNHPGTVVVVTKLPCPSFHTLQFLGCNDTVLQPLHTPGALRFVHGMTTAAGLREFQSQELGLAGRVLATGP